MALRSHLRTLRLHVTLAIVLPAFLWLGWWQLHRALSGNELSWAYTFEWPLFAVYAIVLWWRLLHEERGTVSPKRLLSARATRRAAQRDAADAADLAAYNAYLAALARDDESRQNRAP